MDTAKVLRLRPDEMTLEEAAEYLGIRPQTLRNRMSRKEGPENVKNFGRLRFRKADLDAYIKANTERRRAYS
jgi:excisionase family DNA binding protein